MGTSIPGNCVYTHENIFPRGECKRRLNFMSSQIAAEELLQLWNSSGTLGDNCSSYIPFAPISLLFHSDIS